LKIYEALAKIIFHHGLDTCFALLGDANMHWAGAQKSLGTKFIYTWHEHAAVAAATSYARNSGKIGFASVTCGPGLTQVMTILPIAVRAKIPLLLFAGEAPLNKAWYNQKIDHAPFVTACGAEYRALYRPETMMEELSEAIIFAKEQQCPVVVGIPFDLQKQAFEGPLVLPEPTQNKLRLKSAVLPIASIKKAAEWLCEHERIIILAGLGACSQDAKEICLAMAKKTGALLATTLPAKGLFHDQDFCLGVAGGYASEKAREIFKHAQLVIAVGSRLASHTFDDGKLTPNAKVIQIDISPNEYVQGRKASNLTIKAEAAQGLKALSGYIQTKTQNGWRTEGMKQKTTLALTLTSNAPPRDGFLHPMSVISVLQDSIPASCHIINTSGHCAYFTAQMNKHPNSHYTVIRDFGAIGNGTSFALGIAALHPDRPVILLDGDGSAIMHIQELDTMRRHKLNIMSIVLNDGGYGSEIHKLRVNGVSLDGSMFDRVDFEAVGTAFGLRSTTATSLEGLRDSLADFLHAGGPAICNVQISNTIASPQMNRLLGS